MHKLTIENFKSYREATEITIADLTLNVGMNSVGKSTMIQSILLLSRIASDTNDDDHVFLNDKEGLELGQYQDIVSDETKGIRLGIDEIGVVLKRGEDSFSLAVESSESFKSDFFEGDLFYINAERMGPRNYQTMSEGNGGLCGVHGENTYRVLAERGDEIIPSEKCFKRDGKIITIFSKQVEYWMSYITSGIQFMPNESKENRIAGMRMRQMTMEMDSSAPYNFGFGISYTLSMVATCLLAPVRSLILIENPEAHLHPAGQSHIGQFLAQMMDAGLKIVVETHSEHVINGIRVYCLKNRIRPERIGINYFQLGKDGTQVEQINLDEKMNLCSWPRGFFDQEETDLMEIRELRKKL